MAYKNSNSPVLVIKCESNPGIRVVVFENVGRNGQPFLNTRIEAKYYDKNTGEWKNKGGFFHNELAEVTRCMLQALKWVCERMNQPYPADLVDFTTAMRDEPPPVLRPEFLETPETVATVKAQDINFGDFDEPE